MRPMSKSAPASSASGSVGPSRSPCGSVVLIPQRQEFLDAVFDVLDAVSQFEGVEIDDFTRIRRLIERPEDENALTNDGFP